MMTSNITCQHCAELEQQIARLSWNDSLNMYNRAGGLEAIRGLPEGFYTVIFADVDRLKAINSATGSHLQTNRYLAAGLRVRRGELAMQFLGDEFVFVLAADADADAFIARITRQLAEQPLTDGERATLAPYGASRLSATFAGRRQVRKQDISLAIEDCSIEVLAKKGARAC